MRKISVPGRNRLATCSMSARTSSRMARAGGRSSGSVTPRAAVVDQRGKESKSGSGMDNRLCGESVFSLGGA